MLNRIVYRFFTLCFIAASFLDAAAMADLSMRGFDREPWVTLQSASILIGSLVIPLYLLWRNLSTLPSGRSILPDPRSSGGRWGLELAMVFVWLGSLVAGAWLLSLLPEGFGGDSRLLGALGGAYLTGTLKVIAIPIIFAVEILATRHGR